MLSVADVTGSTEVSCSLEAVSETSLGDPLVAVSTDVSGVDTIVELWTEASAEV